MKKLIQQWAASPWVIYLLYLMVRIYLLTVSVKIENEKAWTRCIQQGGGVVICMFHQQFFYIVRFFRKYLIHRPCMMISRSRDGDIGALVANYSGCRVARGSSSRGGKAAMEEMIAYLTARKGFCINLVDGPQGPMGIVKPGSVRIAQKSDAVMVPAYFISDEVWQLNSWDGFIVPKPFSRVRLRFGESIPADGIDTPRDFEEKRQTLERAMAPYLKHKTQKRK